MVFTPKFVDLVRNFTTVQGTGPVPLGNAVAGYTGLADAVAAGEQFYYCLQSVDKPQEREVGRGTMQANGTVAREPVDDALTHFSSGTKTIALVAAAEWFGKLEGLGASGADRPTAAASRSALAGTATASGPGAAILSEAGREGLFVFEAADLAEQVSADSAEGLYIAPSSDPSGASGAWVRKFDGPVNPMWFGLAEGDAGGANGPANSAAMTALLDTLRARAVNLATFYQGVDGIRFPPGFFEFAETIDISDATLVIEGAGTGFAAGDNSILKFPAGRTGIRIQRYNTSGGDGGAGAVHRGGDGTIVRGLVLRGGFAGAEGESHGIHAKARFRAEQFRIERFEGDGIYSAVTAGSATIEGNSNNSIVNGGRIQECRNGMFVDGADANVWSVIGVDVSSNRQWGIWDSSFLGNSYFGGHSADNGVSAGGSPSACVSHAGNRYGVAAGQEAGASTNAPSGTSADNAWWYYIGAGGTHTNFPAWADGGTYRAGGAYRADSVNAANVFSGCYAETGQGKAQLVAPTLVVGGNLANYVFGTSGIVKSGPGGYLEASQFKSLGAFRAEGSSVFGSTSGGNLAITFENGVSSNTLTFRSTSGTTQTDGAIITTRNQGFTLRGYGPAGAQGNINLQSGTTSIAQVISSGINLLTGYTYKVNNVPVVGSRKAGWSLDTGTAKRSANASYAAGPALTFGAAYDQAEHEALATRMAAVEAALQDSSQTIKALKDDLHGTAGHGLIGT